MLRLIFKIIFFKIIKPNIWYSSKLQLQGKKITLCEVLAHIRIQENEEVDKAVEGAIDMPSMTTRRLPYTDYYLTIRRARNSVWEMEWENGKS